MPKGILNKASLVMVPEAPIDGTMPSVFPEDRSGDFTFTRGSNTSATRVNKDGIIEKGRVNWVTYSNDFSQWFLDGCTATSGQAGYDGTNDAWKIYNNFTGASLRGDTLSPDEVHTFSVYAKAGDANYLYMMKDSFSTDHDCVFNLQTGEATAGVLYSGDVIEAGAVDMGNGWWRCYMTAAGSILSNNTFRIYAIVDPQFNDSTINKHIFIQDAQIDSGLVMTEYIESGATAGTAGLLENEPRIDFTGGGCGALLLEPQRTNLVWFSEYLGGAFELGSSTSIEYNSIASPDGYKSASKVAFGAQGTQDYFRFQFTNTANTTYVGSIFLKRGNFDEITVRVSGNAVGMDGQATFNLANGTFRSELGSVTPKMEDYGNGWYRCSVGDGTNATIASPSFRVSNQGLEPGFVYAWGAQLEEGSYLTSYIPNHYNWIVTRPNEFVDAPSFSSILPSNAYTLLFEFSDAKVGVGSGYIYRMDITGTASDLDLYQNPFGTGGLNVYLPSQGGYIFGTSDNDAWGVDASKAAISYDGNRLAYFINGTLHNSTTGIVFSGDTKPNFRVSNSSPSYKLDKYVSFPTALTDEECSALTQP